MTSGGVWAVVPSKGPVGAKLRLSSVMTEDLRGAFAMAMLRDVLTALAGTSELRGVIVVTANPDAAELALTFGARVLGEPDARGHTAAVATAAGLLKREGARGMLALPGDIPLVKSTEIDIVVRAADAATSFVIAPAWDEQGSNAILVSPPDAVPLKYGDNSFFPHLASAEAVGITPSVLRLPGIAQDIDNPTDLRAFLARPEATHAHALLARRGFRLPDVETSEAISWQEGVEG